MPLMALMQHTPQIRMQTHRKQKTSITSSFGPRQAIQIQIMRYSGFILVKIGFSAHYSNINSQTGTAD
jgi:hypothetical protein